MHIIAFRRLPLSFFLFLLITLVGLVHGPANAGSDPKERTAKALAQGPTDTVAVNWNFRNELNDGRITAPWFQEEDYYFERTDNGTRINKLDRVPYGTSVRLKMNENPSLKVLYLTYGNNTALPGEPFPMNSNAIIHIFARKLYSEIEVIESPAHKINVWGSGLDKIEKGRIRKGAKIKIRTAIQNNPYILIDTLYANDIPIAARETCADLEYECLDPKVTLRATHYRPAFTVQVSEQAKEIIRIKDSAGMIIAPTVRIKKGTSLSITLNAPKYMTVKSITINEEDKLQKISKGLNIRVEQDLHIDATTELKRLSIIPKATPDEGGKILVEGESVKEKEGAFTARATDIITVRVEEAPGYRLTELTFNGRKVQGGSYQHRVVSSCSINAIFQREQHRIFLPKNTPGGKVTITDASGKTIDIEGTELKADRGSSLTINAVPDPGYALGELKVNETRFRQGTATIRIVEDLVISCRFQKKAYSQIGIYSIDPDTKKLMAVQAQGDSLSINHPLIRTIAPGAIPHNGSITTLHLGRMVETVPAGVLDPCYGLKVLHIDNPKVVLPNRPFENLPGLTRLYLNFSEGELFELNGAIFGKRKGQRLYVLVPHGTAEAFATIGRKRSVVLIERDITLTLTLDPDSNPGSLHYTVRLPWGDAQAVTTNKFPIQLRLPSGSQIRWTEAIEALHPIRWAKDSQGESVDGRKGVTMKKEETITLSFGEKLEPPAEQTPGHKTEEKETQPNDQTTPVVASTNATVRIYPNPTHDIVTVECQETPISLTLYSALGQPLQKVLPAMRTTQIATRGLPPGTYYLRIESDKFTNTHRIIRL